jgi:hypothetical protein
MHDQMYEVPFSMIDVEDTDDIDKATQFSSSSYLKIGEIQR